MRKASRYVPMELTKMISFAVGRGRVSLLTNADTCKTLGTPNVLWT